MQQAGGRSASRAADDVPGPRWLQQAGLGVVATLALAAYGIREQPIFGDHAYLVYLGQAVLRGDPIYSQTFFGYPPTGPLLSAAAMAVGAVFGVPSYLAVRYPGVGVAIVSALLLQAIARRASGKAWVGLLAGVALVGFGPFATLTVASLEPKALVVLFALAAGWALQRRRWLLAGFAAALSASCWPPALVVEMVSTAVVIAANRRRPGAPLAAHVAGAALAALPSLLYLHGTDGWLPFWQRAVMIPAEVRGAGAGARSTVWLGVMREEFACEIVFFAAAALGLGGFAARSLRRGPRRALRLWLHPRLAGLPPLAVGWIALDSLDFQGAADMLPTLPAVAFFAAWGAFALAARTARTSKRGPLLARLGVASLMAAAPVYAFADAWLYTHGTLLSEQIAVVRRLLPARGGPNALIAFDAPSIYVLGERRSPMGFLSYREAFAPYAHLAGYEGGCKDVVNSTLERRPQVVVMRSMAWQSGCLSGLPPVLEVNGFVASRFEFLARTHGSFAPGAENVAPIVWAIYRHAPATPGPRAAGPAPRAGRARSPRR